jgi:shikimate 5-dehydrogenase
MRTRTKVAIVGVALIGTAAGGAGIAVASGATDDDASDVSISGDALDQASAAALEFTGEGRVSGTEVGDEESYYEVEVTLDNGSEVDVQLDEGFTVVSSESEGGNETDDAGER